MGMKISLPSGKVVEIDMNDYLAMDKDTPEGIAAIHDVVNFADNVKHWDDTDSAEIEDSLKFIDKEPSPPESMEDFEQQIYIETLKQKTGTDD